MDRFAGDLATAFAMPARLGEYFAATPANLLTDCCQQGCGIVLSSKERSMVMNGLTMLRGVRHYVGRIRRVRNEIRTQRFLNTLPADIRKDIGWPDLYGDRMRER